MRLSALLLPLSGAMAANPTLSPEQFQAAIQCYGLSGRGYPPACPEWIRHYGEYRGRVASSMDAQEQAMFLANALWETGGLQWLEEVACKTGGCPYGNFYGRGLLQLTWQANYEAASQGLYGDGRLCQDPNQVASNDAWSTALWYWETRVKPLISEDCGFGVTVRAINGALECPAGETAHARWAIYRGLCNLFGIPPRDLSGC